MQIAEYLAGQPWCPLEMGGHRREPVSVMSLGQKQIQVVRPLTPVTDWAWGVTHLGKEDNMVSKGACVLQSCFSRAQVHLSVGPVLEPGTLTLD